jgi:2-polyprenyl-3-methyl-5-hydroxy-6-metoxy-1,4-benzoquinol methylase
MKLSDEEKLKALLSLVNEKSQPNLNVLAMAIRNIPLAHFNIKAFGYDLARQLTEALPVPAEVAGRYVGLSCKTSTQADIESDWVAYWCRELQIPVTYHRKTWELAYVLQAIHESGFRTPDLRGLGFGCGVEPLPSYLAMHGIDVTMTDLHPERAREAGWSATKQHARTIDFAYQEHLVDREAFDRHVALRYVDMNAIPGDLADYDFCWSICALEHLGSIAAGLDFIRNSLKTLRIGGMAVHTTEYNIDPTGPTIDNWATVLFQRHHIETLAAALIAEGHKVAPLDFDLGGKMLDRFVDLPPFHHDLPPELCEWLGPPQHLKVSVDGFAATCFGLIVWRGR